MGLLLSIMHGFGMAVETQVPTERADAPQNTPPEGEARELSGATEAEAGMTGAGPEMVETIGPRSGIAPVWLQRLSLFVMVLFCVYLGVLVMVLPWWTRVWDENPWIQARPALAALLHSGAVRGIISGLGLLHIWIGISEAVHYRDHRG